MYSNNLGMILLYFIINEVGVALGNMR